MSQYIRDLIKKGEHQQLDFKYCITDSRKIARSLVAFSNTEGGTLLIGVKDNGMIAGIRSDEEFYMVQGAAQLYSRPEISFDMNEWILDGKNILEIIVPKSHRKPRFAQDEKGKWMVYIRVNDQNLLANHVQLVVWERMESKKGVFMRYTDIEKFLFDYLREKQNITFSQFYKATGISRKKAEKILVNMILMNIIRIVYTEKGAYYILCDDMTNTIEENEKN